MFHMLREFKAVHGQSPYEYLQRRRTEAAMRLLQSTDLAVAEIADRVGFDDRSTLVRRLRRYHGMGPRELRALAQVEGDAAAAPAVRHERSARTGSVLGYPA